MNAKRLLSALMAALLICLCFTICALESSAEDPDPVISLGKKAILYAKNAKTDADYVTKTVSGLTDGNTADNWAYGDFGTMYAQIDLQLVCSVTAVTVQAYAPYNHAWTVSGSTDGTTFTEIVAVPTTAMTAEGITSTFSAVQARYIRVTADYYVTPQQFSFREVTVYGTEPEIPVDPVVSLGKPGVLYTGTASDHTAYSLVSSPKLTDGQTADNWAYGAFGTMYAQIDLETVYNVSAVNVQAYAPYKHGWTVFTSEDGEVFTETAAVSTIEHPAEGVSVSFLAVPARYVRVVADYYVTSQMFSFREVTVRGTIPPAPLYPYTGEMTVTLPDGSATAALNNGVYDDWQAISGANGGYVTIDLKAVSPVDSIAVYAYENNSAFSVFGSADGSAWTFLGFKELNSVSNTSNGWEYTLDVSGSYRYIRVQWAQSARSDGYLTIKEIDISNVGTEYTDVTIVNTKIVYQNNNSDDGNYSNYTFYKKADGSVLVDLGKVKDMRKAAIFTKTGGYGVLAEYSADGTTWQTLGRAAMDESYDPSVGYIFTAEYTNTRYLRLTCLGSESGTFDLSEIVVYTPDAPEEPVVGMADETVLNGGSYVISETNALGETVTSFAGAVTGTVDTLTVPAHVVTLVGAFDNLTVGKLILKNPAYDADSVAAAAASGAEIYALMTEDGAGTFTDLAAAGANVRDLFEPFGSAKAETVGGVNFVTVGGMITADDLDFDELYLTVAFRQNGVTVKEKTVEITGVYTTVRGFASTDAATAASQSIYEADGVYLFAVSVRGVPAGDYDLNVSVRAMAADADGEPVTVVSEQANLNVSV